ncbi:alpha/beta hydrolase [Burkholderia territorii]|uniref:Alpha/beta hydrolase n=1 Tax=Burkholderia territorii TaxID=1503055 RepID=A0A106DFL8_9BURK|nr:alpha/beta hydrolase [Burkholderia territorii]KVV58359.1 alpha/beta hydrolase [Burkholderia territorii]KVX28323.1 alpha/beta hydrolase [Burkholderia territorii]
MLDLANRFVFDGHRIAWGTLGEGPPLVLVHGTPFSSQVWRRIAPWLARRHRVFFYDLLGYGESDMPDADVSLGRQNVLFGALLDEWNISRPRVLAHDYGGATALRAHFLDGIAYSDLTLVNPVAIAPQGSPFVRHVAHHEAAFAGLPAYAHRALVSAYIGNAVARPLSDDALSIYCSPWLTPAGQPAFYRQIAQMRQRYIEEAEARYAPPDFPVRIVWGEDDAWIPLEQGQAVADRIAGGRLIRVPRAGHLVQEDAPEAIVAAMLDGHPQD